MYYVDQILPEGALLSKTDTSLSSEIAATNALWISAEKSFRATDPDQLAARAGGVLALPSDANTTGISYDDTSLETLLFRAKTHGGLVVEDVTKDANEFTFALIYKSVKNAAKTLITVNSAEASDYIFVSEQDGEILFKNDATTAEIIVPAGAATSEFNLLVGGLSNGRLSLQINGGHVHRSAANDLNLSGSADLFIGCRSHRSGILKTLGDSRISDVFFWSGINHLDNPELALQLVENYWREVIK